MAEVYKGIAFPFRKGDVSFPARSTDDDLIKQSLVQILLTQRGERINRPDFGTGLVNFIFEPNDDILAEMVRVEVSTAISKFEPRVLIEDIVVEREDTSVIVTIYFVVRATRQQQSVEVSLGTGFSGDNNGGF
jgi:uncharacterized protein